LNFIGFISLEGNLTQLSVGDQAPDFKLPDYQGNLHQLSDVYKNHFVLLVFNIGFA
jgi:peroxiredoxin